MGKTFGVTLLIALAVLGAATAYAETLGGPPGDDVERPADDPGKEVLS
jgi:hypothetical protein